MAIDLTGRTFGRWTVTAYSHRDDTHTHWWRVVCVCGTERVQRGWLLLAGKSTRCGACAAVETAAALKKRQERLLVGTECGGWRILAHAGAVMHGRLRASMWTCLCLTCGAVMDISRNAVHKPTMPVCRHGIAPSAETLKEN